MIIYSIVILLFKLIIIIYCADVDTILEGRNITTIPEVVLNFNYSANVASDLQPIVTRPTSGYPNTFDIVTMVGRNFGSDPNDLLIYVSSLQCYQVQILRIDTMISCNLMNIEYFQSLLMASQNIYILKHNKTILGKSENMFIYRDIVKCPGGFETICNNIGNCSFGVCACTNKFQGIIDDSNSNEMVADSLDYVTTTNIDKSYLGPTCNLQPAEMASIHFNNTQPIFDYIYSENLFWNIRFTKLNVYNGQDNYLPFEDFQNLQWTITKISDDVLSYLVTTPQITIEIIVERIKTNDLNEFGGIQKTYSKDMVQLQITLSNAVQPSKYQLEFYITTNYISTISPNCDYSEFYVDTGRGYSRNDVRWLTIRKYNTTLYSRFYSRCLADGLPERCPFDIKEDPVAQSRGELKMNINFETWTKNITVRPDFVILKDMNSLFSIPQDCKEKIPHQVITQWLLPTLLPVVFLGLTCLVIVIYNLFKVNRKSFEFEEVESTSSFNDSLSDSSFALDDDPNFSGVHDNAHLDNSDIENESTDPELDKDQINENDSYYYDQDNQ
ncbi:hypothetical protein DLAC_07364 [Tieghemostelium lacteum]|uniref:IPT/TIG domain-containing protein n=1 Tax=Tieghemostelium lacteum TaxID=361077 RepID=A0A151ZCC0_TIELA|nr:hypothetical protein DLAC_07364 [Tieghemostelium lacteum]|eukprot:KYQ91597.1 hypothetical protein DLAC_07364 [Tieghemostelium lacteum]